MTEKNIEKDGKNSIRRAVSENFGKEKNILHAGIEEESMGENDIKSVFCAEELKYPDGSREILLSWESRSYQTFKDVDSIFELKPVEKTNKKMEISIKTKNDDILNRFAPEVKELMATLDITPEQDCVDKSELFENLGKIVREGFEATRNTQPHNLSAGGLDVSLALSRGYPEYGRLKVQVSARSLSFIRKQNGKTTDSHSFRLDRNNESSISEYVVAASKILDKPNDFIGLANSILKRSDSVFINHAQPNEPKRRYSFEQPDWADRRKTGAFRIPLEKNDSYAVLVLKTKNGNNFCAIERTFRTNGKKKRQYRYLENPDLDEKKADNIPIPRGLMDAIELKTGFSETRPVYGQLEDNMFKAGKNALRRMISGRQM